MMNLQTDNSPQSSPSKAKRWGVILTLTPLSLLLCASLLLAVVPLGDTNSDSGPMSAVLYLAAYLGVAVIASATMVVMFKVLVGGSGRG